MTGTAQRGSHLIARQLPAAIHRAKSEGRHPQHLRASAHVRFNDLSALCGHVQACKKRCHPGSPQALALQESSGAGLP